MCQRVLKACELSLGDVDCHAAALVIHPSMAHGYSGHVSGYEQGLGSLNTILQHAEGMTTAEVQLRHQGTSEVFGGHFGGRFLLKHQASWS